jgi:putative oxidoreductase
MNSVLGVSGQRNRRARVAVRCTLGAIFIGAGVLKLGHPAAFHANLLVYGIGTPDWFFRSVAVVLPWVETFSGGFLLADLWTETVGILVTGMCLVFVLALGQAVLRGLELKCGCFGDLAAGWFERPPVALLRACVLLAASVWLLLHPAGSHQDETMPAHSSRWKNRKLG